MYYDQRLLWIITIVSVILGVAFVAGSIMLFG